MNMQRSPVEWFRALSTGKKIGVGIGVFLALNTMSAWNVVLSAGAKITPQQATLYGALAYAALLWIGTYLHFLHGRGLGHLLQALRHNLQPTADIWRAWVRATMQVAAVVIPLLLLGVIGLSFGTHPLVVIVVAIVHHNLFFRALRGHSTDSAAPSPQRDAVGPVAADLRDLFPQADRVALQETEAAVMAQPAPRSIYDDDSDAGRDGGKR